jgi:hypothetical protein
MALSILPKLELLGLVISGSRLLLDGAGAFCL